VREGIEQLDTMLTLRVVNTKLWSTHAAPAARRASICRTLATH
jgi:hypothetical protein